MSSERVVRVIQRAAASVIAACLVIVVAAVLPTFQPVAACVRSAAWPAGLIAFYVASNGAIALAYAAIPVSLLYLLRRRRDIPVDWVLIAFASFIAFCGFTHVLKVVTIWFPLYWLSTEVDAATGVISLAVAVVLPVKVIPKLLAVPSPTLLREVNDALRFEVDARATAMLATERALADKAAVEQKLRQQLALAERQSATIAGLTVPILQVDKNILLLPLVGVLDSERASQATDSLLHRAATGPARYAILDLTGIDAVDTTTAAHMLGMVSSARLIGVEVLFSGIRPGVAQTMVSLGIDLQRAKTFKSLGDALDWARHALAASPSTR